MNRAGLVYEGKDLVKKTNSVIFAAKSPENTSAVWMSTCSYTTEKEMTAELVLTSNSRPFLDSAGSFYSWAGFILTEVGLIWVESDYIPGQWGPALVKRNEIIPYNLLLCEAFRHSPHGRSSQNSFCFSSWSTLSSRPRPPVNRPD